MATIAEWIKIDGNRLAESLDSAASKLTQAEGELVLDLSDVRRIDTAAMLRLEQLATAATEKRLKLALRGVTVDIYKVLKLARFSEHFVLVD